MKTIGVLRCGAVLLVTGLASGCVVRARPVVVVHEHPRDRVDVVEVREAPPPVQVEVRPEPPHTECIWIEGHWVRTRSGWEWEAGYWVRRPHAAAVWVPGHWRNFGPGTWKWVPGHWQT
jgi:hypothetical protein